MKIVRGRLKPMPGSNYEYISVKGRIKGMIEKNPNENFDFVIEDKNRRSSKSFGPDYILPELIGKEISIIDDSVVAKFHDDGRITILEPKNESLSRQSNLDQLNRIRKMSKGTDIGDRISDMNKEGANINYMRNPIDSGIESYEEFEKRNKKFVPSWNLKNIRPYIG